MAERVLTAEMVEAIEAYFPRYPTRRAVTLPALHVVHDRLRYVPLQAVREVAELLELHPAEVQDTLSFYGFFKQDKPHGRTRVWVCRSISCSLRGADELLEYVSEKLGIQPGETTDDGKITLEFAECLGVCEQAPSVLAGDRVCGCMTKDQIEQLLESLLQEEDAAGEG